METVNAVQPPHLCHRMPLPVQEYSTNATAMENINIFTVHIQTLTQQMHTVQSKGAIHLK